MSSKWPQHPTLQPRFTDVTVNLTMPFFEGFKRSRAENYRGTETNVVAHPTFHQSRVVLWAIMDGYSQSNQLARRLVRAAYSVHNGEQRTRINSTHRKRTRRCVMAASDWGLCKECQWWQIEPTASIADTTMGLCIEESLQPFRLRVAGNSGCNRYT